MAKIFKTAFDEVVTNHISTTTKELNFDSFTECGTYQIYEDMGNGRSCTHQLIVDKSAEGACTTQTRICKGNTSYRCYDSKTEKWPAWTTQGGNSTSDSYSREEIDNKLAAKLDAGTETNYVSMIELSGVVGNAERLYQAMGITDKDGRFQAMTIFEADTKPKQNSTNLITSGAVYDAIGDIDTALENIITKYGLGGDSV